jgi:hypothetical protein
MAVVSGTTGVRSMAVIRLRAVKQPSPLTIDIEFIPQLRNQPARGPDSPEPPQIKETIRLLLADRSRLGACLRIQ